MSATWQERRRGARLSHQFIADALGYSNRAKVAQAFGWDSVPVAIRLFIVLAERMSPAELAEIITAIRGDSP